MLKLFCFVTFSGVPGNNYAFSGVPTELTGVPSEYQKNQTKIIHCTMLHSKNSLSELDINRRTRLYEPV